MEKALNWFLILTVCGSFIIIDGLSHSRLAAAENYERADRMLSSTNASGFISIDCGSSKDYLDEETGFQYQTDANFVDTGESITLPGPAQDNLNYPKIGKRLKTLRCFAKGKRNCYTLRPEQGNNNSKYLIRAFISYGNYDGKNQTQSFDLYLGVNLWQSINLIYGYTYESAEVIHTPTSDTIQVCLVRTGPANPCISALELRPLNSSLYPIMSTATPQPLLITQLRMDVGFPNTTGSYFSRYKDDVYDRLWRFDGRNDSWYLSEWDDTNTTGNDPTTIFDASYGLPAEVLRTAGQSQNVSSHFQFDYSSLSKDLNIDMNSEYYVYFHFTEIKQLPVGQKRIIESISLNSNGNILSQPLVLEYLKPLTIFGRTTARDNVIFSISAASESDAPPILNAFEIYKLRQQSDSPTDPRDVGAILDIKSAYKISRLNWQGDPCLPAEFAWDSLICSSETNPRIRNLNLSSSKLTGEIITSFSYLTALEVLDLSNNQLEGPLPEFLAELPKLEFLYLSENELEGPLLELLAELPKLRVLDLKGNKFSGPIPKALREKAQKTLLLRVDDNPELCTTDSCNNKNFVVPLAASLSTFSIIILISLGFWIFKRRQKVKAHSNLKKKGSLESKHQAFSYIEILNVTGNFTSVIGEGGFGKVYLGILQDRVQVAVKMLSSSSVQGFREFRSEVQLLSLVRHRNLVSLLGYCDEGEIKALIYEYMANGNLQQYLSEKNPNVLKWNERLSIAINVVNGLDYLHNGCQPPIVHRDLKTSNILLDQSKHAKIADFGLSRAFPNDIDSYIITRPAGTPGYIDPEFHKTGTSNKKSDVYSIGIILLELITGQPAIIRATGEVIHILQWVAPLVEGGDIHNIVDPRLEGKFNADSAWKIVEIALSCSSPVAAERPDINQILAELKECLSLEMDNITPGMSLQLEITELALSPR